MSTLGLNTQFLNLKKMKNLVLFCFLLTMQQLAAQENPTIKGKLEFKIQNTFQTAHTIDFFFDGKLKSLLIPPDVYQHEVLFDI